MSRTSGRVTIPRNAEEVLTLASKVYFRHQADGDASPLRNLDGINWLNLGPTIEPALAKHREAEALKAQMEKAYRERDIYLPAIDEAVRASSVLLKALNQKNPKRLSDWGFNVDDSVQLKDAAKGK
ncbi:MAG: hypothetical protein GZ094_23950 [Mariniphaga sp.]|nr:hypothetical protein [Mariniphaga sp.]